jgi:hypothetical protein
VALRSNNFVRIDFACFPELSAVANSAAKLLDCLGLTHLLLHDLFYYLLLVEVRMVCSVVQVVSFLVELQASVFLIAFIVDRLLNLVKVSLVFADLALKFADSRVDLI